MIIVFITLFMFGQNDSTRTSVYDEFSHVPWEADSEMEFYVQKFVGGLSGLIPLE